MSINSQIVPLNYLKQQGSHLKEMCTWNYSIVERKNYFVVTTVKGLHRCIIKIIVTTKSTIVKIVKIKRI